MFPFYHFLLYITATSSQLFNFSCLPEHSTMFLTLMSIYDVCICMIDYNTNVIYCLQDVSVSQRMCCAEKNKSYVCHFK